MCRWNEWFASAFEGQRVVAQTKLLDGSEVSTVFLGLDHQWGDGPPMLFETGLFFDETVATPRKLNGREIRQSDIVARYSTWAEAEVGHMEIVEQLTHGAQELGSRRVQT